MAINARGSFGADLKAAKENRELKARLARLEQELKDARRELKGSSPEFGAALPEINPILDCLPMAIRIIDKNHIVRSVNKGFAELSGISAEDAVGKKCFEIYPGPFCDTDQCRLRRILAGEQRVETETLRHSAAGSAVSCIVTALPLVDERGNLLGLMESFRDITERKKLEKELGEYKGHLEQLVEERTAQLHEAMHRLKAAELETKRQKQSLQSLMDAMPAGVYLLDRNARIAYINKAGQASVGIPLKDAIGKTAYEMHPERENAASAVEMDLRVMATGQPNRRIFSNYEPKGERWFTLDRYPYRDENDQVCGEIIVEVEITDRIKIETQLEQALGQERVLRDRVQEQHQQRIEFTRALVHELKTPLTPLIMASEMLTRQVSSGKAACTAKMVYRGAISLNERIDELLDLAKGEIGLLRLNRQPHDLSEIVREVANYMEYTFKAKSQVFSIEIPAGLPIIEIDDQRVKQIITNLLDNASKYTPRRGRITLTVRGAADGIVIEVADTGLGISRENAEKIFEPYHGLRTDSQPHRGMGLGLSLSRMLTNLHGGNISVDSRVGQGSVFRVFFPYQASQQ